PAGPEHDYDSPLLEQFLHGNPRRPTIAGAVNRRIEAIGPRTSRRQLFFQAEGMDMVVVVMVAVVAEVAALVSVALLLIRSSGSDSFDKLADKLDSGAREMDSKLTLAMADMASR